MTFIGKLFKNDKPEIECPRCLGKGHVDWDDIKRLKQELKWRPDTCAYCNGSGKVSVNMKSNVPVGETYLTTELSKTERQRLIDRDVEVIDVAQRYDKQLDDIIKQITYLHFSGKLEAEKIAEFFLLPYVETLQQNGTYLNEKDVLVDYINRVIQRNK